MYIVPKVDEIKRRRLATGFSQFMASKKANLNGNTFYRIENRETARTHHLRAREIARALNCKVSDIFIEPNKLKGN